MGWLRTNWLDALIFLLVAAIMAGVVLFLTGVNPFSGSKGEALPPSPAPLQAQPSSPAPAPEPTPQPVPVAPTPRPQTPPKPAPQPEPETVVTVLPVPQAPASKPVPAPPKVEEPQPQPAQPERARPAPAPRPEHPALTADVGGSWRVMVGSFGNRENAERLASTLRRQGYPVHLEVSGELTRVWVGPYSSQARARAIANTLSQYQPQVTRTAAREPEVPHAEPAPSASRFLQVGAFRSAQSAQAVVETVRQAGYPVELVEEGGLVKVRVGPLDDAPAAAAALRARGLEVLEVR
ncbi:MAG: SPOR domain-containing protein [Meiothermus sp.]|nr:SPOR domain-containing protein [Meiothermus sp.]